MSWRSLLPFLVLIPTVSSVTSIYNMASGNSSNYELSAVDASLLRLTSSITSDVPAHIRCAIGFSTDREKIVAVIQDFNTLGTFNQPCNITDLQIYSGLFTNDTRNIIIKISGPTGLCGKIPFGTSYDSTTPNMTLYFKTYVQSEMVGNFHIIVTPFDDAPCNKSDDFECDNGRCISKDFTCDLYNNCGDNSDESERACVTDTNFSLSAGEIVGIVLGILVLVILLPGLLIFFLIRQRRHNYHKM